MLSPFGGMICEEGKSREKSKIYFLEVDMTLLYYYICSFFSVCLNVYKEQTTI